MSLTDRQLREICIVNPSPWDNQRFMVRIPTKEELDQIPMEYEGLTPYFKEEYDQGNIGSCVGHGSSEVLEVSNYLLDNVDDDLSAWDCYTKARIYDGLPDYREGSTILGALKAMHKLGICTETCWPTIADKINDPGQPCPGHEEESLGYGIDSYWQIPVTIGTMMAAIYGITHRAAYDMPDGSVGKIPLIIAHKVHDSFKEGFDDGIVPQPLPGDKLLGYHCSVIDGWKIIDSDLYWTNQGSWGKRIGDKGRFYLPWDFPIIEAFLIHNGPPTGPTPSPCNVGRTAADILNLMPRVLGRRGRFRYMNP